jgi:hypothetical protein
MRKLGVTFTALAALAAATLGSAAAPTSAQISGHFATGAVNAPLGDGSVRFVRDQLTMASSATPPAMGYRPGWPGPTNLLPYIEQDQLHRSMSAAPGEAMPDATAATGIGSILDGWANRDLDVGIERSVSSVQASTNHSTWPALGTRSGGEAIGSD